MNRRQRRLHAWTWTLIMIVVASVSLGALVARYNANEATRMWAAEAGPR